MMVGRYFPNENDAIGPSPGFPRRGEKTAVIAVERHFAGKIVALHVVVRSPQPLCQRDGGAAAVDV